MLDIELMTNGVRTVVHDTTNTAQFTEELNAANKFSFKIFYGDESYHNVFPGLTEITVYDTVPNEVIFQGTVYSAKPTAGQEGAPYVDVVASHLLARLSTANVVGFEDHSGDIHTMVGRILAIYNSTAKEEHKIYLGTCPYGGHAEVVHIFSGTCFDALTKIVVEDAGWEFNTRYYQGKWYLDISDDFGEFADTDIIQGVNLLDLSKTVDVSNLYTRIIPIGGASYIKPGYVDSTMTDTTGTPEGMPLTLYGYWPLNPHKIYVANEELEKKYPIMAKVVKYDDVVATKDEDFASAQGALYRKAAADAAKLTDVLAEYSVNAIDLARAGYNFDIMRVGKMYHIINNRVNIDTYLKVIGKKTDYSTPYKSELTFGKLGARSNRYISKKGKSIDQKINDVGSASYTVTDARMGGLNMMTLSRTAYADLTTKNPKTLYTVSDNGDTDADMYIGDKQISGGGGGPTVSSAAILTNATVADFVITQETMIDYSPATKVLYGAAPAFIICQENYAMMAYNWTNTEKASCVTNEAYFPDAVHFTCYYVTNGLVRREEEYIYSFVYQRSWSTSAKGEYISRKIRKIIYEYPNNDPEESPTFISDTIQKLMPTSADYFTVKDVGNNTTNLANYTTDMFMVPRARYIYHKNNANALLQPFFPEGVDYYCALYFDTAYENNGWGWIGPNDMTSVVYPFKTRAEQDFSMGVTQRVEPVED